MALNFSPNRISMRHALAEQRNIMGAVMLRDLRTRFFNHGLGFLLVPLFPFAHLLALILLNNVTGASFAYGDDINVFLVTGLIPTLSFMYVSRYMSMSLLMNKPMLAYPIIGMLEVVFGRAVLEVLSAIWMATAVGAVFLAVGSNPLPVYPVEAFAAFCVTLLLAVSVGLVVSIITMMSDAFATVWALFLIIFYVASGSFFVVSFLPELAVDILSWNPVLHCTEWMRTAYYPGYPDQVLDKGYVVSVAIGMLVLGLLMERVLRHRLLVG
ncbi:ABC transporter permease [Parasedimentitalea maritima]|uniref:ABC transporter permease n=1 Tax=Parasedimentitalea maritima TaxID=2578117 RepID=A0A6A4RF91_9RHOB|nr:ABC transporter permease [Zongyanglinia marina]KAE9629288.1 ABC transporter permease [Zongyanglinia marina]